MKCLRQFILYILLYQYADSRSSPLGTHGASFIINVHRQTLVSASQLSNESLYYDFTKKSVCGYKSDSHQIDCEHLPEVDPTDHEDSKPASPGSCGINSISDRILDGEDADLDEFPWLTLLGYIENDTKSFHCGGSLINRRYVLTAAHCVAGVLDERYRKPLFARLGEHDLSKIIDRQGQVLHADPVQDIFIMSVYIYEKYSDDVKNFRNNIAIVRLAKRVKINFFVKPICLIGKDKQLLADTRAIVAGWGQTLNGKQSDVKQKLSLKIYDKKKCVALFKSLPNTLPVTDEQICAGGFGENYYKGDSGGPLMIVNRLGFFEVAGILSNGHGCWSDNVPGVYTNVSRYIDWIQKILQVTNV